MSERNLFRKLATATPDELQAAQATAQQISQTVNRLLVDREIELYHELAKSRGGLAVARRIASAAVEMLNLAAEQARAKKDTRAARELCRAIAAFEPLAADPA